MRVEPTVRKVLSDVRRKGDAALRSYAATWDGLKPGETLAAAPRELRQALQSLRANEPGFVRALGAAAKSIRQFCEWQKPKEWIRSLYPGVRVGQIVRP